MKVHRKLFAVSLLLPTSLLVASCTSDLSASDEPDLGTNSIAQEEGTGVNVNAVTEAPQGFDNKTNGFTTQTVFDENRDVFEEFELIADGLGPVYNTQSCRECHQNPVTGAGSQISELRAGHFNGTSFVDQQGGSLINDRAIDARIQERVLGGNEVRTFRLTISLMGDGFVEAIDSNTLAAIAAAQPAAQRGTLIQVPVGEANNALRAGRFGWKHQQASLLSFAADAYVNEMGITSTLQPRENTSNGNSVAAFDTVADPEDDTDAAHPFGIDIAAFTDFMRGLKAPPRDTALAATASAQNGRNVFIAIGCGVCHRETITTAPAGTVINQGAFTVPTALGDKNIHPFSDFLLHDIGTGDGIVQNGGQGTRNQVHTAALWGMRARGRLMHDGLSVTRGDAIQRHNNQAATAKNNFNARSATDQNDLINFLNSL
jgi:CxxC motif-containing protein (DUF1111 family)